MHPATSTFLPSACIRTMSVDWGQLAVNSVPTATAIAVAVASVILTAWLSFKYQLRVAAATSRRDGRKQAYVEGIEALKTAWTAVELSTYNRETHERADRIMEKMAKVAAMSKALAEKGGGTDSPELKVIASLTDEYKQESRELNWQVVSEINTVRGLAGWELDKGRSGWDLFGDTPNTDLLAELASTWLRLGTAAESRHAAAQIVMRLEGVPDALRRAFAGAMVQMKQTMDLAGDRKATYNPLSDAWFGKLLEAIGDAASSDLEAALAS